MSEEIDELRQRVMSLFSFFVTGRPDEKFTAMLADQYKYFSNEVAFWGLPDRVSFLEMKVGRRVTEDNPGFVRCNCNLSRPGDFDPEPDCPTHGDPKVLVQLDNAPKPTEIVPTEPMCTCGEYPHEELCGALQDYPDFTREDKGPKVEPLSIVDSIIMRLRELANTAQQDEFRNGYRRAADFVEYEFVKNVVKRRIAIPCTKCNHPETDHVNDGLGCIGVGEYDSESDSSHRCHCPRFAKSKTLTMNPGRVEEVLSMPLLPKGLWGVKCDECNHAFQAHHSPGGCAGSISNFPDPPTQCGCVTFTTSHPELVTRASQSESYFGSAQFGPLSRYEPRQSSSHSQCKYRHAQIAGDLLARMASTSESNPRALPVEDSEQFFRTWLALWTCEADECRAVRRLVELALSNPHLG